MNIAELLTGKKKETMVLFHSRFRSFRRNFGSVEIGKDAKGNSVRQNMQANFDNYALALELNEDNAPLIALLRKHVGGDYIEVDFKRKVEEEATKDSKIKELEAQLKELKERQVPGKPVKVRASKVAAS